MQSVKILFQKHRQDLFFCIGLGLIVFLLQGNLLFTDQYVISEVKHDVYHLVYFTQGLAQESLNRGEVMKWNPYMFGGTPFLGAAETMMLYPPRWLLCHLPVATALNWYFFLHVWLMGVTMYCWVRYRGMQPLAAFVSGAAIMLSGSFFYHVFSGHAVMGSYAWAPLIFLGIDGWLKERHFGWILLSAVAAALQILAGFVQIFYLTAIFAGLYSLLYLFDHKNKLSSVFGLLAIYPICLFLAAAQFLPDVAAMLEGIRSKGMPYSPGVPLENLSLTIIPHLFGGGWHIDYWGRIAGPHEVSPYIGAGIFFLIVLALCKTGWKNGLKAGLLILLPLSMAIGEISPTYKLAYHVLPLYKQFRSSFRVEFLFALFAAYYAGMGMNHVITSEKRPKWLGRAFIIGGLFVTIAGISVLGGENSWFHKVIKAVNAPPWHYYQMPITTVDALTRASGGASIAIIQTGLIMLALGIIATWRWKAVARYAIPAICVVELVLFALPTVKFIPVSTLGDPALAEFLRKNPGDFRVLYGMKSNYIPLQSENLWGFTATIMRRYAEMMFYSQGCDPDYPSMDLPVRQNSKLWSLLRGKYAMVSGSSGVSMQLIGNDPLPRFVLAGKYTVMTDRNEILRTLDSPGFDFRRNVILEKDPKLPLAGGDPNGAITILESSSDEWIIDVTTDRPAILLMTDAYSKDWKATAMPGSSQAVYDLQPADWAVRGIPLNAGEHKIKIKYTPWGYHLGLLLGGLSWVVVVVFLAFPALRRRLSFAGI